MPVIDCLNDFKNSIIEARSFIAIAFQVDAAGTYLLPQNQIDFITESAFLKIFISWETFLERVFVQYMIGEPSILGNVVGRYVSPVDEEHARKVLIGTQKYVDWASPDIVRKLSTLYFHPINPINTFISSSASDIFDLKIIRNSAAHSSSTTSVQLDALGTRKLQKACSNLTVASFIFDNDPSVAGQTILDSYLLILQACAQGISEA